MNCSTGLDTDWSGIAGMTWYLGQQPGYIEYVVVDVLPTFFFLCIMLWIATLIQGEGSNQMDAKLCFNCFEKVDPHSSQCQHCGAVIKTEKPKPSPKPVFETISEPRPAVEVPMDRGDFLLIAVSTSILGLLQIFTTGVLNSINAVSDVFLVPKVIDGLVLTVSGFIYFTGILLLSLNYSLARRLYLLGNIVHLYLLYRIHQSLSVITLRLSSSGSYDLPEGVQRFISNINFLSLIILVFGLMYVIQSVYMYRREISRVSFRSAV